ncbi:MAG: isoaspartyl peptidase/L-asparaginase family protein, partial [Phycisphaerales bacterium]
AYRASLDAALSAGESVLRSGGSSLDAVEASVRVLEDDPMFNAGRGSVLTRAGECELDASIMDGRTLGCGAVAGVRTVKNPISFARRVMQETPHVLFTGSGAEGLAETMGVERVEPSYFITPRRRQQLEKKLRDQELTDASQGTVGCVAIDTCGNIAAATSTGGMTAKIPGRVGDSPIIGAGCYANNLTLGVSCTGTGEQFIRNAAAHELSSLVRYRGLSLEAAARTVLTERLDIDDGGLIAIDRNANVVMMTTTGCMPAACSDWRGRREFRMWDE